MSFSGIQTSSTGRRVEDKERKSEPTSVLDLRGSPSDNSQSIAAVSSCSETEFEDGEIACQSPDSRNGDEDTSWVECFFSDYVPSLSEIPSLDDDQRQSVEISEANLMDEVSHFHSDFSLSLDIDGSPRTSQYPLYPVELANFSISEVLPYAVIASPHLNAVDHINHITDHSKHLSNLLSLSQNPDQHSFLSNIVDVKRALKGDDDRSYDCIGGRGEASSPKAEAKFVTAAISSCPQVIQNRGSNTSIVQMIQELQEENGLHIVHLLFGCVEAIKVGNLESATLMLRRLQRLSSSLGNPIQRLAVYFTDALSEQIPTSFMLNSSNPIESPVLCSSVERELAYQAFYQTLPFIKFAHLTANQAILETVRENSCIHIVDLDVRQGLQWSSFIQSLAMRSQGGVKLKLTAVGADESALQQTGRRLCEFARSFQVRFQFNGVAATIDSLHPSMFEIEKDDILAVSCPFVLHQLLENQQQLQRVLSVIKSMSPTIVAVLEIEANYSDSIDDRFVEALHFYSAVFDSLECTLDRGDRERLRIESIYLASGVRNVVAMKGSEGVIRYMRSESWRELLGWAGLRDLSFSYSAIYQARLFLSMYSSSYKICQEGSALTLGWHDTPMVSVSTWNC